MVSTWWNGYMLHYWILLQILYFKFIYSLIFIMNIYL